MYLALQLFIHIRCRMHGLHNTHCLRYMSTSIRTIDFFTSNFPQILTQTFTLMQGRRKHLKLGGHGTLRALFRQKVTFKYVKFAKLGQNAYGKRALFLFRKILGGTPSLAFIRVKGTANQKQQRVAKIKEVPGFYTERNSASWGLFNNYVTLNLPFQNHPPPFVTLNHVFVYDIYIQHQEKQEEPPTPQSDVIIEWPLWQV